MTLLLLLGVLGVTPAAADPADAPRCHIDFDGDKRRYIPSSSTFIVRSQRRRGAIGVWQDDSGDRLRLRVRGEGKASKTRHGLGKNDYQLVRCETT
jgi:hypothetical protein